MPSKFLNVFSGKYITQAETYSGLFQPLAKKPGGSFPGATYEKEKTSPNPKNPAKKQWIGKPGFIHEEINYIDIGSLSLPAFCKLELKVRLNTISEKIAFDLYDLLSRGKYVVPKTRLAILPWINEYTKEHKAFVDLINEINRLRPENSKLEKGLHILSKYIDGYNDLNQAMVMYEGKEISFCEYIYHTKCPPEEILFEGEKLALMGFMEILAVAKLLNDVDVLGGNPSNIGFVIEETSNGRIARAVKIDPGLAFNRSKYNMLLNTLIRNKGIIFDAKPLENTKDIQLNTGGGTIAWNKLNNKQKIEFLTALDYGLKQLADEEIIDFMVFRQGEFNVLGKTLTLKCNYIQNLILIIKTSLTELQEVYTDGLKYIAANPQSVTSNVQTNSIPSLSSTNSLDKNRELVEIKPGPLSILKHLEYRLDNWVNGTLSLSRLFDNKEAKNRRNEARKRIIECYKSQQPILDLSNLGLNTLPDSLFAYFEHLTEFNLSNNQLTILPNNIDKLVRLKILDINNNPLNRNHAQGYIYLNIVLDIWINESNCPKEEKKSRIMAKTKIIECYRSRNEELDLSYNNLSNLPEGIFTHVTFLKKLSLYNNKLEELPNDIGRLTNLSELSLYNNQLVKLPESIGGLTKLSMLSLNRNQLTELPESTGGLTKLSMLSLSNNELTKLPESIGELTNLSELWLSNNQLTELPESIGGLTNLSELSLNRNQLTKLPENIGGLTKLSVLWLNSNQLTELPESIGRLTNLSELWLDYNQLTGLPESIGGLNNLSKLSLENNQLTELPESIGGLTRLFKLWLDYNQLTKLPESIGGLTNLSRLQLRNNQLTELPEGIGRLTNLSELELNNNQLTKLPESIGGLTNLSWLLLSNNQQLTELPKSISGLTNLSWLELNNNQLTELPESIGRLTNLSDLSLSHNQLFYRLPVSFSKLINLEKLNINLELLTELPDSIKRSGNLKVLEFYDVGKHSIDEIRNIVKGLWPTPNLPQISIKI